MATVIQDRAKSTKIILFARFFATDFKLTKLARAKKTPRGKSTRRCRQRTSYGGLFFKGCAKNCNPPIDGYCAKKIIKRKTPLKSGANLFRQPPDGLASPLLWDVCQPSTCLVGNYARPVNAGADLADERRPNKHKL
jgi:hypothetical protein